MAKNTFLSFSTTAGDNTDVGGIGILGSNAVSNFDNALRTLMAILRGDLDNGTVFVSKAGGHTAVAGDNNAFYEFTATATLSLTAAATLAADWHLTVFANGGTVTVDPAGAELVNGAATLTISDGDTVYIICTGTGFKAITIPSSRIRYFAAGAALPTSNIGPIWHDTYGDILTWQSFLTGGANYVGYASANIGQWSNWAQSSPPQGWLSRNGAVLLKADYPALWNYALHRGLVGTHVVGTIVFQDTSPTQFKLPDTRGYFDRPWGAGVSIDSGRVFGSAQSDDNKSHTHGITDPGHNHSYNTIGAGSAIQGGSTYASGTSANTGTKTTGISIQASGGSEARPYSTAPLGVLKF